MAEVSRTELMQAANMVKDKADIIRGIKNALDGHRAELAKGWSSTASMTFHRVHNDFDEQFNKVLHALEGMYQNLADQKLQYDSKEEMSREAMSDVEKFLNTGV